MILARCLVAVLLLIHISCRGPMRPEDLPPCPVEIDIARDTILHTPNGAFLSISAHTLAAGDASRVRLLIRQNGDIINIKAPKDQPVTLTNAIYVALPAAGPSQNKWFYKGTPDPDGRLRFWKNPQPLFDLPPSDEFWHGKKVFMNNCIACHVPLFSEPDLLRGATQRHDRQWLIAFTRNSEKLRTSGDQYTNALYNQFNKTAMPAFPHLSDQDIDNIYHYIDEFDRQRHPPFPDSVLPHLPNGYYQFPINELGWYHVDTRPPSNP